jgi:hypothetical protein
MLTITCAHFCVSNGHVCTWIRAGGGGLGTFWRLSTVATRKESDINLKTKISVYPRRFNISYIQERLWHGSMGGGEGFPSRLPGFNSRADNAGFLEWCSTIASLIQCYSHQLTAPNPARAHVWHNGLTNARDSQWMYSHPTLRKKKLKPSTGHNPHSIGLWVQQHIPARVIFQLLGIPTAY